MTSLLPFIYTWRCECDFETINFDLKFPRFIAWIFFLISWFNSHLSITTNLQKPNAQHEKPHFFPLHDARSPSYHICFIPPLLLLPLLAFFIQYRFLLEAQHLKYSIISENVHLFCIDFSFYYHSHYNIPSLPLAPSHSATLCTYKCMLFSKWNGFE